MGELILSLNLRECHTNHYLVRNVDNRPDVYVYILSFNKGRSLSRVSFLVISTNKHSSHVVASREHIGAEILSSGHFVLEVIQHLLRFSSLGEGIHECFD